VYYTLEEQDYMNSRHFTNLRKGEWLFAATEAEGEQAAALIRVSTKGLDPGEYESQNKNLIERLRSYLMERDGIPLPKVAPAVLPPDSVQEIAPDLSELTEHGEPPLQTDGQQDSNQPEEFDGWEFWDRPT
jgi:hypothetical protein